MEEKSTLFDDVTFRVQMGLGHAVEQRLKLWIRPKPGLIPQRVWEWMLRTVLSMEMTLPQVRNTRSNP